MSTETMSIVVDSPEHVKLTNLINNCIHKTNLANHHLRNSAPVYTVQQAGRAAANAGIEVESQTKLMLLDHHMPNDKQKKDIQTANVLLETMTSLMGGYDL